MCLLVDRISTTELLKTPKEAKQGASITNISTDSKTGYLSYYLLPISAKFGRDKIILSDIMVISALHETI